MVWGAESPFKQTNLLMSRTPPEAPRNRRTTPDAAACPAITPPPPSPEDWLEEVDRWVHSGVAPATSSVDPPATSSVADLASAQQQVYTCSFSCVPWISTETCLHNRCKWP